MYVDTWANDARFWNKTPVDFGESTLMSQLTRTSLHRYSTKVNRCLALIECLETWPFLGANIDSLQKNLSRFSADGSDELSRVLSHAIGLGHE